jgi:hypothetical protein
VLNAQKPAATSKEISDAILAATDIFSENPAEPHDDRTLIVLRPAQDAAPVKKDTASR